MLGAPFKKYPIGWELCSYTQDSFEAYDMDGVGMREIYASDVFSNRYLIQDLSLQRRATHFNKHSTLIGQPNRWSD